jgi:hypothetical protein
MNYIHQNILHKLHVVSKKTYYGREVLSVHTILPNLPTSLTSQIFLNSLTSHIIRAI